MIEAATPGLEALVFESNASKFVQSPAIESISASITSIWQTLAIATVRGGIFSPEFLGQSQLVILVNLRWFQEPTNLGGALALSFLGGLLGGLSVLGVQVCVIIAEFSKLDEKVTDSEFEAGKVTAECEQSFDELRDLLTVACQSV